jgi:uncharacterized membrane protein YccF (DUF307 family)
MAAFISKMENTVHRLQRYFGFLVNGLILSVNGLFSSVKKQLAVIGLQLAVSNNAYTG